jgi:predicted dehydrogenase
MRQLIQNLRTGELRLSDVPYPLCRSKGVVVKTICSVVSVGTEKSIIELAQKSLVGKARARPDLVRRAYDKARKEGFVKVLQESLERLDEPFPLGYSASGLVVEVGAGTREFAVGDRVAIAGAGYANHSEYNFVPQNLCMRIPQRGNGEYLGFDEAAFCMLGGIALQGIRQANLTFGERVAVVGLGLLGLLTAQILNAVGCEPVGVDIDESKCQLARQLGCEQVYADRAELLSNCKDQLDAVLITAAAKDNGPLVLAQEISRPRGRIVLVGVCDIELERKCFWDKELDFRVSKAAGPGLGDENYEVRGIDYPVGHVRWPEKRNMEYFLRLVARDKVDVRKLITHRFPIAEAVSTYEMLCGGNCSYVGVVLEYPNGELPDGEAIRRLGVVSREKGSIQSSVEQSRRANVGFIGGGMFSRNVLLPNLRSIPNITLVGIATTRGMTSEHLAGKFGFQYACSDHRRILEDQSIGSVIITTRHDLHATLVVEALKAGKYVFVEKPLCLTEEELDEIQDLCETANAALMVGFNRRYSLHGRDMKEFFSRRREPLVVNYRVNAGYLEDSHWTQDLETGGGRILGEVCHFVDFLQYVTGSAPIRVYAEAISPTCKYGADDNLTAMIRFHDGSIGTITYTSKGTKAHPREVIEAFQDESVYCLEDFRRAMKIAGNKRQRLNLRSQDMGYRRELEHFLFNPLSPEDTRDCFIGMRTCFLIEKSLQQGKVFFLEEAT